MNFLMILKPGQSIPQSPHLIVRDGMVFEETDLIRDFSYLSSREMLDNGICVTTVLRGLHTGHYYADFITNGRRGISDRLAVELMNKTILQRRRHDDYETCGA